MSAMDPGSLEIKAATDLSVLPVIQRKPSAARIRTLANGWDDAKVGILLVARITDGEYKGRLHIYDGGTRWAAKVELEPHYLFSCWIKGMTMEGAAKAFLSHNKDSMKPSAFAKYAVGIRAGEPNALAVEKALDALGLSASPSTSEFGDGDRPGDFAAFAAADRIVTQAYTLYEGDWDRASALLEWSIRLARRAYPQKGESGAAYGHDHDIVQAVARMGMDNPALFGDDEREAQLAKAINTWYGDTPRTQKLFTKGQTMIPATWRVAFVDTSRNIGGGSSRGQGIAQLIVTNHNRAFSPRLSLRTAARAIRSARAA